MSKQIMIRTRKGEFQSLVVDLGADSLNYVAQSHNVKTGIVPAQYIGSSREESESTCRMCPLWKDDTCYAQDGSVQMGHNQLLKVVRSGRDRGLDQALEGAREDAEYVRFGTIGDPGSIAPEVYQDHEAQVREWGFGILSYTHQWFLPHAQHLKGHALASADTMKDVNDAVDAGWRVAVHVDENDAAFNGKTIKEAPQGTIKRAPKRGAGGRFVSNSIKYFHCPAQREGSNVTCNTCGLCDGTKPMANGYNTIVFSDHGQQMKFAKQREERAQAAAIEPAPTLIQLDIPAPTAASKKGTFRLA